MPRLTNEQRAARHSATVKKAEELLQARQRRLASARDPLIQVLRDVRKTLVEFPWHTQAGETMEGALGLIDAELNERERRALEQQ